MNDEARERACEAVMGLRRSDPYAPTGEVVDAVLEAVGIAEGARTWFLQAYSQRVEIEGLSRNDLAAGERVKVVEVRGP